MPEKTAAEFRADGFFITGDLGRIDERGYVQIVGRGQGPDHHPAASTSIPRRSKPRSTRLPGVVESAVIGLPHPDFGEGVTAVVVRGAAPR